MDSFGQKPALLGVKIGKVGKVGNIPHMILGYLPQWEIYPMRFKKNY